MTDRIYPFTTLLVLLCVPVMGAYKSSESLELAEAAGLRSYDKGDYAVAADNFTRAAFGGMKQSQYMLGFMYLKGQHVQQSLIEGMAWLGVAKESGEREWISVYKQIYSRAQKGQKKAIKARVARFTNLYGMQAQNISCKRSTSLGTNRWKIHCVKVNEIREDMFLPRN